CKVKCGTKTTSLTIKWVIDDGTPVRQGQLLMEIDDSALQDQLKDQKIKVDQAKSAWIAAEENSKIVASQNYSDVETARVTIELAEIDLKKYLEGDYPQAAKVAKNNILLSESDLEQQRDRVAYTERMVKLKYLGTSQLQAEQSRMQSCEVALARYLEEKRVLDDFTRPRTIKDFANKL